MGECFKFSIGVTDQIRPSYTCAVQLIGLLISVSGGKTPRPHTEAGDSVENAWQWPGQSQIMSKDLWVGKLFNFHQPLQVQVSQVQEIREEIDNYIENSQVGIIQPKTRKNVIFWYKLTYSGSHPARCLVGQVDHNFTRNLGSTRMSTSTMILRG